MRPQNKKKNVYILSNCCVNFSFFFLNNQENSFEIYEVEHNILSASGTIGRDNVQGCSEIIYQINIYSYSLGNKLNPRVFTKNVRHNFNKCEHIIESSLVIWQTCFVRWTGETANLMNRHFNVFHCSYALNTLQHNANYIFSTYFIFSFHSKMPTFRYFLHYWSLVNKFELLLTEVLITVKHLLLSFFVHVLQLLTSVMCKKQLIFSPFVVTLS